MRTDRTRTYAESPITLPMTSVPPAVPVSGCTTCALAAEAERHSVRVRDESAAADYRVEIRNHPHEEPKLMIRECAP